MGFFTKLSVYFGQRIVYEMGCGFGFCFVWNYNECRSINSRQPAILNGAFFA
jgi:hypothetical protein